MPVRLGAPQNVSGLRDIVNNPIYSTGVGLLQYGLKQQAGNADAHEVQGSAWLKLKNWFQRNL
jgi:cell division protein FtsA